MNTDPKTAAACLRLGRVQETPFGVLQMTLPYPPTVNTYWRTVGGKMLLSSKARNYRRDVLNMLRFLGIPTRTGPLKVCIVFHAPDNRRRDLDNLPKGLLDALKYAGVYGDDSQVRHLDLSFGEMVKGGSALVEVSALETP